MTEFYNKILVFYNFLKHYLNLIDQLFFEILRFRSKIEKKKKKKGKKIQPKKKSLKIVLKVEEMTILDLLYGC